MWGLGEFTEQIQAKRNLQQFGGVSCYLIMYCSFIMWHGIIIKFS